MRPEGWEKLKKGNYFVEIDEEVFEAGADAMLEGLRNLRDEVNDPDINRYEKGECAEGIYPQDGFPYAGRLVFIEEE